MILMSGNSIGSGEEITILELSLVITHALGPDISNGKGSVYWNTE